MNVNILMLGIDLSVSSLFDKIMKVFWDVFPGYTSENVREYY